MPRTAREWPTRALWVLEDTKAILSEIDALAREAQLAAREGNRVEAVIIAGDIRAKALTAFGLLTRARNGEYDKDT